MEVPFTQYILPNGTPKDIKIEVSDEVGKKAHVLIDEGVHFDAEILTTGEVSLTAELDSRDDPTLTIEVVANGPGMKEWVEQLIENAHTEFLLGGS